MPIDQCPTDRQHRCKHVFAESLTCYEKMASLMRSARLIRLLPAAARIASRSPTSRSVGINLSDNLTTLPRNSFLWVLIKKAYLTTTVKVQHSSWYSGVGRLQWYDICINCMEILNQHFMLDWEWYRKNQSTTMTRAHVAWWPLRKVSTSDPDRGDVGS